MHDEYPVAGPPDVEFDGVGPEAAGEGERLDGVLGRRRRGAPMGDHLDHRVSLS
ncbi:MAG: hypothetical protein R2713_23275 [Ilumatobacteraceae bacterium]